MTIHAVLFDVDGTLVDNVTICIEAYRQTFQRIIGLSLETDEITRHFGKTEEGILAVYVSPDQLPAAIKTYFEVYEALHRAQRDLFPGMRALLAELKQRQVPLGVATGKSLALADVTLRALGVRDDFAVVEGGFPDRADKAESLRRAARRLNLAPGACIYAGDTEYDIASAAAAGMPVVGAAWSQTTTITAENSAPALQVFQRVEDYAAWLRPQL